MEKTLCKPCAIEIGARKDRTITHTRHSKEKITCDQCNRRRYGATYEVKRVFKAKEATT